MYISGIPNKQGLYWVRQALGYTGFAESRIMKLEELIDGDGPNTILVWRRLEDHSAWPATGSDLYWDIQVTRPKEYECLRRIDEVNEEQEDIE